MTMILRAFVLMTLVSCSKPVKRNFVDQGTASLSSENIYAMLALIDLDPRSDLAIYLIIEERLGDKAIVLTVSESKLGARPGYVQKLMYESHDVFVYDFSISKGGHSNRAMFFENDAPTWKVLVSFSAVELRYFLIEPLIPTAIDTTRFWQLDR